jgi:hypothetical protein
MGSDELEARVAELEGVVSRLAADVAATRAVAETAMMLGGGLEVPAGLAEKAARAE